MKLVLDLGGTSVRATLVAGSDARQRFVVFALRVHTLGK